MSISAQSTPDEVAAWLGSLPGDLSAYQSACVENGVSGQTVLEADPKDLLGKLGVKSIGHKVLIKKAVAKVKEIASTEAPPSQPTPTKAEPTAVNTPPAPTPSYVPESAAVAEPVAVTEVASPPEPSNAVPAQSATPKQTQAVPSLASQPSAEDVATQGSLRQSLLQQPAETSDWIVLKQGFVQIVKTGSRLRLGQSLKLLFFVLKQHPDLKEACLEMYAGSALYGSVSLVGALIIPTKTRATFEIQTKDSSAKDILCRTENNDVGLASSWVVALQQIANDLTRLPEHERRSTVVSRTRFETLDADYEAAMEAIRHLNTTAAAPAVPQEESEKTWDALTRADSTASAQDEELVKRAIQRETSSFKERQELYQEDHRKAIMKTEVVSNIASRYRFVDF